MKAGQVSPVQPRTKDDVKRALASDWRVFDAAGRKGELADKIKNGDTLESTVKKIGRTIGHEHLPEAHSILNTLVADPAGLFNTFMLFGGVFVPVDHESCDDMIVIGAMLKAASEYYERMQDGDRNHIDTAALAKLFKPLVPAMLCIIREAAAQDVPALRAVA